MDRRDGLRLVLVPLPLMASEVGSVASSKPDSSKLVTGYGSLIRTYVQFILAKLRFHRLRPEFNGLFEYEEYISLKGIDDPNEG